MTTGDESFIPSEDALERQLSDLVWNAVCEGLTVDLDAVVPVDRPDLRFVLKRVQRRAERARVHRKSASPDILRDRLKGYVVEKLLGTGGMGEVFLVRRQTDGQRFALKRVRRQTGVSLGGVEFRLAREQQFFRELLTWIGLPRHGNLVACCFFRCLGDELAIFSEYVPDGSLREMVTANEDALSLDMPTTIDLALQTLAGLHCLHLHGVTHQDMKPHNILVGGNGRVVYKINDFGVARSWKNAWHSEVSDPIREEVPVGGFDPVFCSPEQQNASVVSSATDIWSWALTMLFAATGKVTWEQGAPASLVPLEAMHGELGRSFARILEPCLHPDPHHRPNADSLQQELRPFHHQLTGQEFEAVRVASLPEITSSTHEFYLDEEARDLLRQFSSTGNTEAYLLMNKAARLLEARSFDQASQCLRRAFELLHDKYPGQRFRPWTIRLAAALIHVGQVYDNIGRPDRAAQHIELGIDILQRLAGLPGLRDSRQLGHEAFHSKELVQGISEDHGRISEKTWHLSRSSCLPSAPCRNDATVSDGAWLLDDVSSSRLRRLLPDLEAMLADIRRKH